MRRCKRLHAPHFMAINLVSKGRLHSSAMLAVRRHGGEVQLQHTSSMISATPDPVFNPAPSMARSAHASS